MFIEYFYWHYVVALRWLLVLIWHGELALLQFFSVPLMLKTLFAHWHRDAVPYQGGRISDYLLAFAWNQISRAIGFIVRACVLSMYLVVQLCYAAFTAVMVGVWILAPCLALTSLAIGIVLLTS